MKVHLMIAPQGRTVKVGLEQGSVGEKKCGLLKGQSCAALVQSAELCRKKKLQGSLLPNGTVKGIFYQEETAFTMLFKTQLHKCKKHLDLFLSFHVKIFGKPLVLGKVYVCQAASSPARWCHNKQQQLVNLH
jgi:hypothetical protein